MKKSAFLVIIVVTAFCSCSKKEASPAKLDEQRMLITSKKFRFQTNDGIDSFRYEYAYDDLGRIRQISSGGVMLQTHAYTGNELTNVSYYTPTSPTTYDIFNAGHPITANADSSEIKYSLGERTYEQGFDSVYRIYTYNNNRIVSFKTYNNSSQFTSPIWAVFDYEYDPLGNLVKHLYTDQDQAEFTMANILEVDDKKNPLTLLSKIDYIIISQPLSFINTSQASHNVTRYIDNNGNEEWIDYTYNNYGYPLTIKRRSDNFIMTEFEYSLN